MSEWVGWIATAVFVLSYACRRPAALRLVQAVGAALWIVYGVFIGAAPVVVANVLVGGAAVASLRAASRPRTTDAREARRAPRLRPT